MTAIWALLTSRIAGPLASGLSLLLAVILLSTCTAKAANDKVLNKRIADLTAEIDAPNTGWRARLATCEGDFANADAAVKKANDAMDAMKVKAEADKIAGKARQSAAQAASRDAATQAAAVMAKRASGDLCGAAFDVLRER